MTGFEALLADLREGEEITFRHGDPRCNGFGIVADILVTSCTGLARKPLSASARGYGPGRHRRTGMTFCFQLENPPTGARQEELLREVMEHLRFSLQECRRQLGEWAG